MGEARRQAQDFGDARERLEQIVEAVGDEALSLDEALDLFEEAVALGLQVSDLLELGLEDEAEAALADAAESFDAGSDSAPAEA